MKIAKKAFGAELFAGSEQRRLYEIRCAKPAREQSRTAISILQDYPDIRGWRYLTQMNLGVFYLVVFASWQFHRICQDAPVDVPSLSATVLKI